MPKIESKQPEALKPYLFHGLDLTWSNESPDSEAAGECPFCGSEKLNVNIGTTKWQCYRCHKGGNAATFLKELWQLSFDQTSPASYRELAKERGLLNADTPMRWNLAVSYLKQQWVVPGYNHERSLVSLCRYVKTPSRKVLLGTPKGAGKTDDDKIHHGLFMGGDFNSRKEVVYICEGPWDGMMLWETLQAAKPGDDGLLEPTSNPELSLLQSCNVVAVPGCMVFNPSWAPLFAGKHVVLMYDNDHERTDEKTGATIPPGGYRGMQRVAGILANLREPSASIRYLRWGADGWSKALPHGYDLRDFLREGENSHEAQLPHRVARLNDLLGLVVDAPSEWVYEGQKAVRVERQKRGGMPLLDCDSYRDLQTAWRKALKWTDGLDCALSVMLATIASTKMVGDQLWVKIIGPASCGKSTLCEAVSTNQVYVVAKSTIRGFHSGFGDGTEDNSLVARLFNMTLVTKDGDTLLQSPNLGQILAEARDLYDCTSRTHYRNKNSRDYSGVRMTWLLCGTSSLRSIDSSELGERFLDCVVMDGIDDDLEDDILLRVANRADRNVSIESDGKLETQQDPDMTRVMQMTGGYVGHLREQAALLLPKVENPDWAKQRCARLGKFVAYMRARPSSRQDEASEREFAARLVSQLIRLAKCLAIVLNRDSVDEEVMRRVQKVALDTARGQTLLIAKQLLDHKEGMESRALALYTSVTEDKLRTLLRFMKSIGVVSIVAEGAKRRWVLTPYVRKLMRFVLAPPSL